MHHCLVHFLPDTDAHFYTPPLKLCGCHIEALGKGAEGVAWVEAIATPTQSGAIKFNGHDFLRWVYSGYNLVGYNP